MAGGAAGLLLLGRIARLTGRQLEAAAHFSAALEQDPLLWVAFEELCSLGARPPLACSAAHPPVCATALAPTCSSRYSLHSPVEPAVSDTASSGGRLICVYPSGGPSVRKASLQRGFITQIFKHAGAEREARAWLGSAADDRDTQAGSYATGGGSMAGALGGGIWGRGQHSSERVPQLPEQPAHWEGWEGFRPSGTSGGSQLLCSASADSSRCPHAIEHHVAWKAAKRLLLFPYSLHF